MKPSLSASERKQELLWCWVAPPVVCVVYALALWVMSKQPVDWLIFFNSEYGPVEILSAMVFAIIGGFGLLLAARLRRLGPEMPMIWRAWFWLFALGAVFMCLEEISYGQHFLHFNSPEWFEAKSKQQELNLHNLFGDKPSVLLRRVIEIGLPIFAIVAPLALLAAPGSYRSFNWPYYIMPRLEMAVWTLLAALMRPIRKWTGLTSELKWRGSLSEFTELLWAIALLIYLWVMWRRLSKPAEAEAAALKTN